MYILSLIFTSSQAILQISIIGLAGYILTKKGFITKNSLKNLSQLNVNFLTPCLLFSKMASSLTVEQFIKMWPIPLIFTFIFITSILVSKLGCALFKIPRSLKGLVVASVSFSNNNSLPLVLIMSLSTSSTAKQLFWGPDDDKNKVLSRGIGYVVIYSAISNILRWSYGISLLSDSKDDEYLIPLSNAPTEESCLLNQETQSNYEYLNSKLCSFFEAFKQIINPPLISIFLSLLVVILFPIRDALYGPNPILGFLSKAIGVCGGAAIPLVLIGLGSQIALLPSQNSLVQKRSIMVVIFSRFFIIPLLTVCFVMVVREFLALGEDPMFVLVMMIMASGPTAINLINVCQSLGKYEDELAILLFYSYVLAIPCMTFLVTIFLWVVENVDLM